MKNKKAILIAIAVAAAVAVIGGIMWYQDDTKRKEIAAIQDSMQLTFKEDLTTIEYGTETDPLALIDAASHEQITVDPIDHTTLGYKQLKYTMTYTDEKYGDFTKDFYHTINVVDTQMPVIELKEEAITVAYNKGYTPKDNVKSVTDPVDGELTYVELTDENTKEENGVKELDLSKIDMSKGIWWIEGSVAKNKAGKYAIRVSAIDRNGNEAKKEYTVTVKAKKATSTGMSGGGSGSSGSSGGSSGSSSGSSKGKWVTYNRGDEIKTFSTMKACRAYMEKRYADNGHGTCEPVWERNTVTGEFRDNPKKGFVLHEVTAP